MRLEVETAVDFLTNMLKKANIPSNQLEKFSQSLKVLLSEHYKNHWFTEKPNKGSAYRCIRINGMMDGHVEQAGEDAGIKDIRLHFPSELTLWVDPRDVSYRIGEEGSIGVLYEAPKEPKRKELQTTPTSSPVKTQTTGTPSRMRSPVQIIDPATNNYIQFQQKSPRGMSPPIMNSHSPSMIDQHQQLMNYVSCSDQANRNTMSYQSSKNVDFLQFTAFVSS